MTTTNDDVDRFIGNLSSSDEAPPKRKRRAARDALAKLSDAADPPPPPPDDEEEEEKDETSEDERDDDETPLLPRDLPRAVENHRSLGSMISKYQIGDDAGFKLQLHRFLPKFFPGGIQAHGYMEEYVHPITEDYIASEYGGGTYGVIVFGPDPKNPPNGVKRYDSFKVEISGAPNPDRLARSVRAKLDAASAPALGGPAVGAPMMMQQENPGLATQALKMASEMAERERDDRRRAEENAVKAAATQRSLVDPVIEAERRRADEMIKLERERSDEAKHALEERLKDSKDDLRRLAEKVEAMNAAPQRSIADEMEKILPMMKGDGEAAAAAAAATARTSESMTKNLLDNHRSEIEALHKQHQTMLESIRASHTSEIALTRESARRDVDAERESARLRDERHQEALRTEREERRRDNETFKKTEESRDKQWRDRMEQQEINIKTMWESRVEVQKTNFESQITWLRSEVDQLQSRIRGFEAKVADGGDIVAQLSKMRDFRTVAKDALGIDDSPAPSPAGGGGGIGLSGEAPINWQEVFNTGIENLPAIMQQFQGLRGAPQMQQMVPQGQQAAPQQSYQLGQTVQTPEGLMIVVQTPSGQLAFAKKDEYDAYQTQQRTSRQLPAGPKARGILAPAQPKRKPSDGIPVPNMAIGLPPVPKWGEPVQPPEHGVAPQQQTPAAQQSQPAPTPQAQPAARGRSSKAQPQQGNMDQTKVMIANEVAKLVHHSVESGDEPEEFVQKVLAKGYPDMIVQTIAAMSPEEVIAGIRQVQPNSAGATPAGQRFVHEALAALRAAV